MVLTETNRRSNLTAGKESFDLFDFKTLLEYRNRSKFDLVCHKQFNKD